MVYSDFGDALASVRLSNKVRQCDNDNRIIWYNRCNNIVSYMNFPGYAEHVTIFS